MEKEKVYKIQNGQLLEVKLPVAQAAQATITKCAYSVEEARKMVGLGRNKFVDLLINGQIRGKKVGSKWLIPASAINEFLAQ